MSMICSPAVASGPVRPPVEIRTTLMILLPTFTLMPRSRCQRPGRPQPAGHPDQLMVKELPSAPNCSSRAVESPMASFFVWICARLQKSVPVHATMPRKNGEGVGESSRRSGSRSSGSTRSSGTLVRLALPRRQADLTAAIFVRERGQFVHLIWPEPPGRYAQPDCPELSLLLPRDPQVVGVLRRRASSPDGSNLWPTRASNSARSRSIPHCSIRKRTGSSTGLPAAHGHGKCGSVRR